MSFDFLRPIPRACAVVAARLLCVVGVLSGAGASAQEHPAFVAPSGFAPEGPASATERVFGKTQPNGDRLRIRVLLADGDVPPDELAKTRALEPGDSARDDTRQELVVGALSGVAYSCLGAAESVEGVPFTRYRRVMGFKADGSKPFAVRADVLAKEPRPAQSTLETMARALSDWQTALGGAGGPPPDPQASDPSSRPALGGDVTIALKDGGDLEFRAPAAWGRADLDFGDGRTAIYVGPARDVLKDLTVATLAKDKDRIGPYVLVDRIRRDVFKDLVDQQLLDIADSLLADYAAQQQEAGVTLTLGERDEGTLGTRVVVSVPFEEARASGTKHKGRLVAMLHRGVLVLVTASHPLEGYEQGWPDVAAALDTLVFTGAPEADPAAPSRPESAPAIETPPSAPEAAPPTPAGSDAPKPAPPTPEQPSARRVASGPFREAAAPAEWSTPGPRSELKVATIPLRTPLAFAYPAAWTLFGPPARDDAALAWVAAPDSAAAGSSVASHVRVEFRAWREDLADGDAAGRLLPLLVRKIRREASDAGAQVRIESEERATLANLPAAVVRYALTPASGPGPLAGTLAGVVFDGSSVLYDLRLAPADGASLAGVAAELVNSLKVDPSLDVTRRNAGPFSVETPADWTFEANENRAGGYDVFLRAPSGVDVRFQTARQDRPDLVTPDVLRKVANGFLVEGLRVLTPAEFQGAKRHEADGARLGLRFASPGPALDVLALATLVGDQLVFALRGAPAGFRGRDLAVAWRVQRSLRRDGPAEGGLRAPRAAGELFAERYVFVREELDDLGVDGAARAPSTFYVAFLPTGAAGVVVADGGSRRDLRGEARVDGEVVTLRCEALGAPRTYRFAEGGEVLVGADGDVLFRARREETP